MKPGEFCLWVSIVSAKNGEINRYLIRVLRYSGRQITCHAGHFTQWPLSQVQPELNVHSCFIFHKNDSWDTAVTQVLDQTRDWPHTSFRSGHDESEAKLCCQFVCRMKTVEDTWWNPNPSVGVASHTRKHWRPRHEDQPWTVPPGVPLSITCITAVWKSRLVLSCVSQLKTRSDAFSVGSSSSSSKLQSDRTRKTEEEMWSCWEKLQKSQNEIELKHETCARTGTRPGSLIWIRTLSHVVPCPGYFDPTEDLAFLFQYIHAFFLQSDWTIWLIFTGNIDLFQ